MNKLLTSVAAGALLVGGGAFAGEPVQLTSGQLDMVTAGSDFSSFAELKQKFDLYKDIDVTKEFEVEVEAEAESEVDLDGAAALAEAGASAEGGDGSLTNTLTLTDAQAVDEFKFVPVSSSCCIIKTTTYQSISLSESDSFAE